MATRKAAPKKAAPKKAAPKKVAAKKAELRKNQNDHKGDFALAEGPFGPRIEPSLGRESSVTNRHGRDHIRPSDTVRDTYDHPSHTHAPRRHRASNLGRQTQSHSKK